MDLLDSRRSGDNAVEVFGVTLCGHQPLASTGRTALPIGEARATSIVGSYQRFRLNSSFVNGAKGEIGDLLGMTECNAAAAASVTGVGGRRGITLSNRVRHSARVDRTGETASAFHEEFAVPRCCRRQPDFGFDFRISRRPESDRNPAVSRGLLRGSDVGQARHVGTRCLGEQRDSEKEEQPHAHSLLRSRAAIIHLRNAKPLALQAKLEYDPEEAILPLFTDAR